MLEAIKGYVGVMLLCATFLVFGSIVGLVSRPNDNGIYLSLSWDGKEVFVLGKNVMSASSLDLNNLSATDAKILAVKLERLSPNDMLGTDLLDLKDRHKGPFTPVDLKIEVRFIDTEKFSGPFAMACLGSAMYGRKILLHQIVSPRPEITVDPNRLWEFHVVVEQDFSKCEQGEVSKQTIWVNRKMLQEWLALKNVDLPYVSVTGRIMSTLGV